jgi:hypothetical protein
MKTEYQRGENTFPSHYTQSTIAHGADAQRRKTGQADWPTLEII